MINIELLSEVLNEDIIDFNVEDNELIYNVNYDHTRSFINIYELAHKCKEWALNKDYLIDSSHGYEISTATPILGIGGNVMTIGTLESTTEPEAIFKACEYILKENK